MRINYIYFNEDVFSSTFNVLRRLTGIAACTTLLLTAGCGGGGGGGGGQTSNATPRYAQWESLGAAPVQMISTNSGIYGLQRNTGSTGATDKIVKWQRIPGSRGWLEYAVPTNLTVFAPADVVNDGAGISVNWAGFRPSDVKKVYTYANSVYLDDIGIATIVANGGNTGRQWAITGSGSVWYKSSGGGLGTNAKATFDPIKDTEITNLGQTGNLAVADGNGKLYAASANTLAKITLSGELSTWDLPDVVNTLVYAANTLWVGAGGKIYRLNGDTLQRYATQGALIGIGASRTFCVSNNNLYAADGMVYKNISAGGAAPTPVSYLKSTDQADMSSFLASQVTSGHLTGGVYCSDNVEEFVYTQIVDPAKPGGLQLIEIRPLF